MYKFAISVRTYLVGNRRGYDLNTAAGCISAANDLINNPHRGAGKRTLTELYRAGGLGVYQIAKLVDKSPEDVRDMCNRIDYMLHNP